MEPTTEPTKKESTTIRGILRILACDSGRHFSERILNKLIEKKYTKGDVRVPTEEKRFANTEVKVRLIDSIRNADLYIIQDVENSTEGLSVDDNHRALVNAISAARRCDPMHITAITPSFPYARQDKSDGREAIAAADIAREIEDAGADQVIALDIHNAAISGFFRKAILENLHASKNIMDYIKRNKEHYDLENLVVTSPDVGGAKKAQHYSLKLGVNMVFCYKDRDYDHANTVKGIVILGDVKGKDVLMVDDMIDTAGTMETAVEVAKKAGARNIYAACSLPLFNGKSLERLDRLYKENKLTKVIVTDAVYYGGGEFMKAHPWCTEVSVAGYFATVIHNLNENESISSLLK